MLKPTRFVVSLIFLCSMIGTLINSFIIQSWILMIILICTQFCSLIWYTLSYIPGGRTFCTKCLKAICCNKSSDKEESII